MVALHHLGRSGRRSTFPHRKLASRLEAGPKSASLAGMYQPERRNRGDYVPGVDAERNRAERRRNILQAAEERLEGLRNAASLQKLVDPKQPESKPMKRKRGGRLKGFFRV